MNNLFDVPAPAKINLFLHVNGCRSDGYHLLQTVFRFIELSDTLSFDVRSDGIISFEQSKNLIHQKIENDNLILCAANKLQIKTGTNLGAHIYLEKKIPIGAGLGGGSSDAATTLISLNRLWKTGLSRKNLMLLGRELGSDIPVFIFGRSAFASGIGDLLSIISLPSRSYLITCPAVKVLTSDVFSKNLSQSELINKDDFSISLCTFSRKNDLESAVHKNYPDVFHAFQWLTEIGIRTYMSGSGSCLFSEYKNLSEAILAENKITDIIKLGYKCKSEFVSFPKFSLIKAFQSLDEHPLKSWVG